MKIIGTIIRNGIIKGILEGTKVPEKPKYVDTAEYIEEGLNRAALGKYDRDLQALWDLGVEWEDQEAKYLPTEAINYKSNSNRPFIDGIYPLEGVNAEKIRQFKVPPTRPTHLRFDAAVWHDSDLSDGKQDNRLEYRTVLRLIPQPNSEQKKCWACEGTGVIKTMDVRVMCGHCNGTGVEGTEVSEPTLIDKRKQMERDTWIRNVMRVKGFDKATAEAEYARIVGGVSDREPTQLENLKDAVAILLSPKVCEMLSEREIDEARLSKVLALIKN